jgi:hypothetical protein
MLRTALLAAAAVMCAAGLVLVLMRISQPGWNLLGFGGVVLLALVFERWRYRSGASAKDGRWMRTEERFEDPETGEVMEVLFDPSSGRRRYVKARPAGTAASTGKQTAP